MLDNNTGDLICVNTFLHKEKGRTLPSLAEASTVLTSIHVAKAILSTSQV